MRGETLKLGFKGLFFNFSFSFEDKIIPVRENRDFFVGELGVTAANTGWTF